jgi:osmoprotectant transport system permease protein
MDTIRHMLQFIADPQNTFGQHTADTLRLSLFAIALAFVIALPLAVLVAPHPIAAFIAANLSGLVRAVPTLAVLALMIIYFKQIGFTPSLIALTALGIPPILLNTVAGLRGIDPAALDAAKGMGMTPFKVLVRIRVPLVLPVVAAGVRNSAVQIVATVPLAALVGGGGYGDYIVAGINVLDIPQLLVGAICIALLALAFELGLALVQRLVTPAGIRVSEQRVIGPSTAPSAGGQALAA